MDKTIQKTIYKNLFGKTELKSNRVELGLAQDLLQEYKKGVDLFTDAQSTMDRALEILIQAKDIYNDIEQKSSELGIDVNEGVRRLGDNLDSFIESATNR
jgi:hypothetical protein